MDSSLPGFSVHGVARVGHDLATKWGIQQIIDCLNTDIKNKKWAVKSDSYWIPIWYLKIFVVYWNEILRMKTYWLVIWSQFSDLIKLLYTCDWANCSFYLSELGFSYYIFLLSYSQIWLRLSQIWIPVLVPSPYLSELPAGGEAFLIFWLFKSDSANVIFCCMWCWLVLLHRVFNWFWGGESEIFKGLEFSHKNVYFRFWGVFLVLFCFFLLPERHTFNEHLFCARHYQMFKMLKLIYSSVLLSEVGVSFLK